MPLLEVDDLRVHFHTREGVVHAVDGVSFHVSPGETLGIVGESGSGKSVSCHALLGLVPMPPGRIESGSARFDGLDLLKCSSSELRAIRGQRISMIFQDPMTALNPYMTIGNQVMEPVMVHEGCSKADAQVRALEALESVGIQDAPRRMNEYPHQFSGGMRQRALIAMALVGRPKLLIADEPTTALDVTVQAQVLELIKGMQKRLGMAVILITHDMGVIAETCDYTAVMYAGRIVEYAPTSELLQNPRHPYTRALMAARPAACAKGEPLFTIPGMPPDLINQTQGCPFAPRCLHACTQCNTQNPALVTVASCHTAACSRDL